jgi:MFS family permease
MVSGPYKHWQCKSCWNDRRYWCFYPTVYRHRFHLLCSAYLSEIPLAVLLWWLNSHCSLLGLCALWSSVMILSRFIANISQLYISRFLLGTCEAGLFPGLHLYLTTIYTREEQATRISYLLMCTKFSGAMGGLLAFATLKMDGTAGYAGWRWVYIIEGTSRTLNGIEFGTSNTLKS